MYKCDHTGPHAQKERGKSKTWEIQTRIGK